MYVVFLQVDYKSRSIRQMGENAPGGGEGGVFNSPSKLTNPLPNFLRVGRGAVIIYCLAC